MEKGETFVRSTIEYAIMNDVKIELGDGKECDENLKKEVKFSSMLVRYIYLPYKIFVSNLDMFIYFFMIWAALQ